MKLLWCIVSALGVLADDSFITQYEYGQMLYDNPRGIGCVHCHGKHGEGALIATYKEDGKKRLLEGPDIRKITISRLKASLVARHDVMPTYFLTDEEIKALHYYLTHKE